MMRGVVNGYEMENDDTDIQYPNSIQKESNTNLAAHVRWDSI